MSARAGWGILARAKPLREPGPGPIHIGGASGPGRLYIATCRAPGSVWWTPGTRSAPSSRIVWLSLVWDRWRSPPIGGEGPQPRWAAARDGARRPAPRPPLSRPPRAREETNVVSADRGARRLRREPLRQVGGGRRRTETGLGAFVRPLRRRYAPACPFRCPCGRSLPERRSGQRLEGRERNVELVDRRNFVPLRL